MKHLLSRLATGLATLLLSLAAAGTAQAEGQIRLADQFGIVYLLLDVAKDQKLIEKHGKALGIDIQVSQVTLSGGSAVNDALLSGSIDIAGAGVGPLLTLWDRTLGKQNVRGVASLGNFPYYLVSTNPAVKTLADFGDKDRIALPAVGVSVQSRVLGTLALARPGDLQALRTGHQQLDALWQFLSLAGAAPPGCRRSTRDVLARLDLARRALSWQLDSAVSVTASAASAAAPSTTKPARVQRWHVLQAFAR